MRTSSALSWHLAANVFASHCFSRLADTTTCLQVIVLDVTVPASGDSQ